MVYVRKNAHQNFRESDYLLALETSQELVQNTSDEAIRFFHVVWKAKVPNKAAVSLDFVHSFNNLHAKGLNLTTSSCTHYGDLEEDVGHVLFKCSKTKDVCDRCTFGKLYDTPMASTMEDFCRVILDTSPTCWNIFMITLRGLWIRRNKHFHGQFDRREAGVEVMMKQMLLDYSNANKKDVSGRVSSTQPTFMGKKPQIDIQL
ncbi:hypothetical protein Tco_0479242 [Tanacetum coccineum]